MNRVLIKSEDRAITTDSVNNFKIVLPDAIEGEYKLSEIALYNTIYTVISGRNSAVYTDTGNATLTAGYYTTTTLAAHVQSKLRTATGDATITCTFNTTTYKFDFTSTAAIIFQWGNGATDSASELLGFTNTNVLMNGSSSINLPNLTSTRGILIAIDKATSASSIMTGSVSSALVGSFYIPLNASFGSMVNLSDHDQKQRVMIERATTLTIRLYDERGRLLNLNDVNWSMLLEKVC